MQSQIQVDTATLKAILKRDIEMVSKKKAAYDKQVKGLSKILDTTKALPTMEIILSSPGVLTYLAGLREAAICESNLQSRQLVTLKERFRRIESDIITPGGNAPGSLVS
jgi:hypothetical protein